MPAAPGNSCCVKDLILCAILDDTELDDAVLDDTVLDDIALDDTRTC